jgi:LPXTG-motif cell wall-anchored protein
VYDKDFMKFESDMTIKFNGIVIGKYTINEWNKFNIYYNTSSGKWVVYMNDEVVYASTDKFTTITTISKLIFRLGGLGTEATTYLDEICMSTMSEGDIANIIPSFYADFNSYTANKAFDTSNGATSYGSWGNYFPNEAGDNGRGSIAAKVYANTPVTIAQDANGDKVVKFISSGTYADDVKEEEKDDSRSPSTGSSVSLGFALASVVALASAAAVAVKRKED